MLIHLDDRDTELPHHPSHLLHRGLIVSFDEPILLGPISESDQRLLGVLSIQDLVHILHHGLLAKAPRFESLPVLVVSKSSTLKRTLQRASETLGIR